MSSPTRKSLYNPELSPLLEHTPSHAPGTYLPRETEEEKEEQLEAFYASE